MILLLGQEKIFAEPAVIVNEGAVVFTDPDFDSDPKFKMHAGEKIEVSKRSFGPFHRMKTKDNQTGFIADSEYTLRANKDKKSNIEKKSDPSESAVNESKEIVEKKPRKQRPFAFSRYRGLALDYVGYKEQTMGTQPMSNLVMYGFKMVGPNLLVEGEMVTELNVDVLPTAPGFYQQATGNSASGWLIHVDYLYESIFPQGRDIVTYLGFGPMFKYDHYNVVLSSGGKNSAYDLEDMVLGAVFNVGFGIRFDQTALRVELKYDWEKTQYWGIGSAFLFQF